MGKSAHIDVLDGLGGIVKDNCNLMIVCTLEPTTRAEAVTTYALADVAMVTGDFTPTQDGTKRKLVVTAKSAVPIDVSGDATHVAFVDATRLLYVTTCTLKALELGDTVDIPSMDICEVDQPA